MNIIKRIIKNKMKKVLEIFLNLSYNICVCERDRVRNNNNKNNKMDKKYILVSCGGANSEIKRFNKEFNNWRDCYNYVYDECKNERMYSEEIDSDGWVMWERECYMLDIDCWRDDIKLDEKDIVIGIWGIGESDEVYEVIVGDSINDKRYKKNIDVGDEVRCVGNGNGESGICVGFDDDEVILYDRGEGWSVSIDECENVYG